MFYYSSIWRIRNQQNMVTASIPFPSSAYQHITVHQLTVPFLPLPSYFLYRTLHYNLPFPSPFTSGSILTFKCSHVTHSLPLLSLISPFMVTIFLPACTTSAYTVIFSPTETGLKYVQLNDLLTPAHSQNPGFARGTTAHEVMLSKSAADAPP